MSTHENPRPHGPIEEPDRQTSERLLDGREQEHPLADVLASAAAPPSARELRREADALHAFASREVLDARASAAGPTTERTLTSMRSRRNALAAALRPVPLAKAMMATAVAVAAAFAVASAVTGPADPVDATSPAGLSSALEDTTTTTTDPATTTTTTDEPTSTTTKGPHKPGVRAPSACAAWWGWAKHDKHRTWPTTWPTDWPTTWPTTWPGKPTGTVTTSPTVSPTPTATPTETADVSPTGSPTAKPDRKAWKACFGYWKKHHKHVGGKPGFDKGDPADKSDRTDRDGDSPEVKPTAGPTGEKTPSDDQGGSEGGFKP